jgi:DNA processing protein
MQMIEIIDILLSRYRFLTASEKLLLRDTAGSYDVLKTMNIRDIERITGRKHKLKDFSIKNMLKEADNAWNILASGRIKCLFFQQTEYPAQLAEIYNPPYIIYFQGSLPDWTVPSVAVVGTRLASGSGLDAAFRFGFDLAECGLPVVSGLAMGIDSSVHSGAVAAGGITLAVLGGGADRIYPSVNKPVAASILENGGAVLSEYIPGEAPRRHHFPERNRIISGLSRAVVVVEAPGKSGALITADFAIEQGRDLFLHHNVLNSGTCKRGTGRVERMAFDGAPVIGNVEEILNDWGMTVKRKFSKPLEMEARMTSESAGIMMAERMKAELAGYEVKYNGNYFRRACYESSYSISG